MPTIDQLAGLAPQSSTLSSVKKSMGKEDFLKMLVQQLRNQDPLEPLKGTEFAAQLAQFSSVEQLDNIKEAINQSIDANYLLSSSINNALAATFVGKDAKAALDKFQNQGGDMRLGYTLSGNANTVQVRIFDSAGKLVKTIDGTGISKGDHNFIVKGDDIAAGQYRFEVIAKDAAGKALDTAEYIFGTVTGVRFKSDGAVFIIGGTEVPLAQILEVLQGSSTNNNHGGDKEWLTRL